MCQSPRISPAVDMFIENQTQKVRVYHLAFGNLILLWNIACL